MRYAQHRHAASFRRCGDIVGRASAGLVIAGTASFALAALMADLW